MLRFTKEQILFINETRKAHGNSHAAMQATHGRQIIIGNAAPLPKDVWATWDRDAIEIQRDVLSVFNDLSASLSKPMPIGKLLHYFQQVGDSGEVNVSLDGRSEARTDQPEYAYVGTPIPFYDTTFKFGWRQMLAAQSEGYSIDTPARANGLRKIAEKMEDVTLNGESKIVVSGMPLYGLLNHPSRNTRSTGSTLATTTGANWKAEVIATMKLLQADNFYGDVTFYVNWGDWFYASNTDYTANYPKTIAKALMEIGGIAGFVPSSKVPANTIIAIIKRRDVAEVLNSMPITTLPRFRANLEDDYVFKIMAATALELKYDANGQMGLAVSS